MVIAVTALKIHPPNVMRVVGRSMHTSAQLPIRLTVCLVRLLVFMTAHVGLDAVLGAFAAGVIVSLAAGKDRVELDHKLDAIAFGVFIPVFFVVTGVTFDLTALGTEPALWRLPLFLAMFWVARGLPALFIYRQALPSCFPTASTSHCSRPPSCRSWWRSPISASRPERCGPTPHPR